VCVYIYMYVYIYTHTNTNTNTHTHTYIHTYKHMHRVLRRRAKHMPLNRYKARGSGARGIYIYIQT
jgi:hypothetical protein